MDGHRARRVLRVDVPLRGRLQPRPGVAPHRRRRGRDGRPRRDLTRSQGRRGSHARRPGREGTRLTVSVSPDKFSLVNYDAGEIASIIDELVKAIGLPGGLDVRIEVDESTPLGRATITSTEPLVISCESGA